MKDSAGSIIEETEEEYHHDRLLGQKQSSNYTNITAMYQFLSYLTRRPNIDHDRDTAKLVVQNSEDKLSNGHRATSPQNVLQSASYVVAPGNHCETSPSLYNPRHAPDDSLTVNRYFLEEFENLNTRFMETHKLSYVQETAGKKGFY